jgi:hypothetical protein
LGAGVNNAGGEGSPALQPISRGLELGGNGHLWILTINKQRESLPYLQKAHDVTVWPTVN